MCNFALPGTTGQPVPRGEGLPYGTPYPHGTARSSAVGVEAFPQSLSFTAAWFPGG